MRDLDSSTVRVDGSAIVERKPDGTLSTPEGQDNVDGLGFLEGSAIGLLIGVLGGPVGMVLGFGGGALIGAGFDADRAVTGEGVLSQMSAAIPAGTTALALELTEEDPKAIDTFAADTGATLLRRPLDDVLAELAEAEAAAEEAARSAHEAVRAAKKQERKEKRDERIATLKSHFS